MTLNIVIVFFVALSIYVSISDKIYKKDMKKLTDDFMKSCNSHLDEMQNYYFEAIECGIREFLDDLEKLTIQCHDVKMLEAKYKKRLADIAEVKGKAKSTNQI